MVARELTSFVQLAMRPRKYTPFTANPFRFDHLSLDVCLRVFALFSFPFPPLHPFLVKPNCHIAHPSLKSKWKPSDIYFSLYILLSSRFGFIYSMLQYFPFLRHCFPALCVFVCVCVCVVCGLTSRGSNKWCEMKRAVPNLTSERDGRDCGQPMVSRRKAC